MVTSCPSVVAVVLAATFATACLHPQSCPETEPERLACDYEATKEAAPIVGFILVTLAVVKIIDAASKHGDMEPDFSLDRDPVVPKNHAARSAEEKRALSHAAAGRCRPALAIYRRVRERDAAAARLLELDEHVAACLAIEDARARGVMP